MIQVPEGENTENLAQHWSALPRYKRLSACLTYTCNDVDELWESFALKSETILESQPVYVAMDEIIRKPTHVSKDMA